ncbi:MAG: phosphoribosylamine--glycine ligase [Candidatus Rokuibacteriota bacterium]|nr:MAG: phosphoribosylamine--glycine ligase [Candidatus Rokubacteria bacterium]
MKVLLVGSGGREHALAFKIAQSPLVDALFAAPGNPGIARHARCVATPVDAHDDLVKLAERERIDFTVVGPEAPLVAGLADRFAEHGLLALGPAAKPAQLEGSKAYSKRLMARHAIPTARFETFVDPEEARRYCRTLGAPLVVKADGLAAGKGAIVEEISFFALANGLDALPLGAAQDHKTVFDGDRGPNTGGMGAYSPVPGFDAALERRVMDTIVRPTITALAREGTQYRGVLFVGLMLTADGPKVLEYNCRWGDPECQVIMTRLDEDIVPLLLAAANGAPLPARVAWKPEAAVCVNLVSGGYPGRYPTGLTIAGVESAALDGVHVFHAGTAERDGRLVTAGGRVLGVTANGRDVRDAMARAYAAAARITFDGLHYRRDIGYRGIATT